MKILNVLLCTGLALGLAACTGTMTTRTYDSDGLITSETTQPGSIFGPSSYDIGYRGMYQDWRTSQAQRAKAISKLPCPTDPIAAAYCNNSKMLSMAFMSTEQFTVKAPVTGFDVLNHAVDTVVPVAGFMSLYKLGVEGIKGAGSSFGNDATVTDSMNQTSTNPVNFGAGSAAGSSTGTAPPTEPVIVQPSYAPTLPVTTP